MALRRVAKRFSHVLRRYAPWLYDFLIEQLSSNWSRTLRNLHRLPRERRLVAENAPLFAVNVGARCGIGALLSFSAQVLAYADDHHLSPRLLFTNPVYATVPGENWLPRYFEQKGDLDPVADNPPLARDRFLPQSINTSRRLDSSMGKLTLRRLSELFSASLAFRQELLEEAAHFCATNNVGNHTLGVHYRGTDKRFEASVVPYVDIANRVASCLGPQLTNIFVATDEPEFLAMMAERFGRERVVDLDCQEIFTGLPAHLTEGNPGVKAHEALQTILVLSRCGLLIRTRSHLSAWSKIINPSLPVIVYGEARGIGFPENLIHTDA